MISPVSRRDALKAISVGVPSLAALGALNGAVGTPPAAAIGAELGAAARLAQALSESAEIVGGVVSGLGQLENERALFFLLSAYDLATEMWFQKGDPLAPVLTNWEYPWRKYAGDNPTTLYFSAPVSPDHQYRLRGPIGDAIYAGVQVYTRGAGFNAPSANISDTALLGNGRQIDLLMGGSDPADGTVWMPLAEGDYLFMVRLYHDRIPVEPPHLSVSCLDAPDGAVFPWSTGAVKAEAFFRDMLPSTLGIVEGLREAGVNRYPTPDAPVQAPRFAGALFPTRDNVYDGLYVSLGPGQALRLRGRVPITRFWSFVFYDRWFNTPDLAAHRCFLTGSDIKLQADGTYEVVLGPRDPGHPNWIDTAGLTEGICAFRTLLPQQREIPTVDVITL